MSDTELPIVVKHAGQRYDVSVDLTSPGVMLKIMLFSLTNVEPERQKILVKGGQLKDDADMGKLGLKPGQTVMMMGTPSNKVIQAPKEKMKFVEDMTDAQLAQVVGATPSGLQNLGNTCYLNSTLQALRYIPELQDELQKYQGGADSNPFGGLGGGAGSLFSGLNLGMSETRDLTRALRDLYKQMGETTEGVPPLVFLDALRSTFPQFQQKGKDGRYAQQDAEECYSQILHQLHTQLKIKNDKEDTSFVKKYLTGTLSSKLKCVEDVPDNMPIEATESFVNLKCHIGVQTNFLKDGIMAGLTENVEKHNAILDRDAVYEKTSRITHLPKYLTCHFVRFFWKRDVNKKAKIMRKVIFPLELDATEFCSDDLKKKLIPVRDTLRDLHKDAVDRERARKRMKITQVSPDDIAGGNAGEGGFGASKGKGTDLPGEDITKEQEAARARYEEKIPDWNEELKDKLDPEIMKDEGCNPSGLYELFAVVTHQGASADSGHYCAYVKKDRGDGKTWYFFNDDTVTEVDQQKIETLYGGGESHSALIVLYRAFSLSPPTADKEKSPA